jgi:hypothetical protein
LIRPDETAGPTVERHLASKSYDCVVIGAGVRLPPRGLALFEAVINAVHKAAPGAAIAFNTTPGDSADAAARWLAAGSPLYSPASNKTRAPASGPRGSKVLLGRNEDAALEGLGKRDGASGSYLWAPRRIGSRHPRETPSCVDCCSQA